jgi:chlorobactene glucosyltransferase
MFVTILLITIAVITLWVISNARQWPHTVRERVSTSEFMSTPELVTASYPFVSILVPARNEQRVIEACLMSLLEQDYPNFEVICLDDRSEDHTADILDQLQARYPHLKRIYGKELPAGWIGKCHACHQLSLVAEGEYLLFTDADSIHERTMLRTMTATVLTEQASFLTGFPRVVTNHMFGWLILPLLFFVIVLHLPLRAVSRSQNPKFIAAHGAFLLFNREAYDAIGGHHTHRNAIVEDMSMAKAIKKSGRKALLVDITPYVACDMYEKPRDVWHGFSKNMFVGLGASTPLLFVLLTFYTMCYVFPIVAAIICFATGSFATGILWLMGYALTCLQKYVVDRRFSVSGWWFLLIPLSFIGMIGIALRSWYLFISKKGYTWKGRVYHR